jgi:hypothetical protein
MAPWSFDDRRLPLIPTGSCRARAGFPGSFRRVTCGGLAAAREMLAAWVRWRSRGRLLRCGDGRLIAASVRDACADVAEQPFGLQVTWALVRYCISACIMVVCAVLEMALQMQTESAGYFVLLPGVFLSGLIFDHGSGILAAMIAQGSPGA